MEQMQRHRRKAYPNSVLKHYIKLYIKRRNAKNKMMEAVKSWTSLSNIEKEQFVQKYDLCRLNHKKKIAHFISKAQPYLRKKKQYSFRPEAEDRVKTEASINNLKVPMILENEAVIDADTLCLRNTVQDEPCLNIDDVNDSDRVENPSPEPDHSENSNKFHEKHSQNVLAEPAPPNLRTGKELFYMINSSNGESNVTWTSLTRAQKLPYYRAVALLKSTYISKLKAYLNSLPSKELFNYYNAYIM